MRGFAADDTPSQPQRFPGSSVGRGLGGRIPQASAEKGCVASQPSSGAAGAESTETLLRRGSVENAELGELLTAVTVDLERLASQHPERARSSSRKRCDCGSACNGAGASVR